MTELKHRLAALHPKTQYHDVVINSYTYSVPTFLALNFLAPAHKFKPSIDLPYAN